jgi:hypothetical protein
VAESTETRLARIEEKITAHNELCDSRWARIEKYLGRTNDWLRALIAPVVVGVILACAQHFWK